MNFRKKILFVISRNIKSLIILLLVCFGANFLSAQCTIPSTPNPGTPNGPNNPCQGTTVSFSVNSSENAISYSWFYPSDWVVVSGANTKTITVKIGSSGNIGVFGVNSCGNKSYNSSQKNIQVTPSPTKPVKPVSYDAATCSSFKANWDGSFGIDGGSPVSFLIDVSTDESFTSFVGKYNAFDVGNVSGVVVTGLVSSTKYYYRVRKSNACLQISEPSDSNTITTAAGSAGGAVKGGSETVCSGSNSGLLKLSGYSGTVQKWQSSVSPFTNWVDIANTKDEYTSGPLSTTTWFRAVLSNGTCITNSESKSVLVTSANASISYRESSYCKSVNNAQPAIINGTTGGIFTSFPTGLNINRTTGAITPFLSTAGNYIITYTYGSGVCTGLSTITSISIIDSQSEVTIDVSPTNVICEGVSTNLTFTASPINGGTSPFYQWILNGSINVGTNSSVFTSTSLKKGDIVTVIMTSNAPSGSTSCLSGSPALSNGIKIETQTTTFNGSWTIPPAANLSAEIRANYSSNVEDGKINVCSLTVANNSMVTIKKNYSFTVQNNVKVDDGSSLIVESDANLIQVNNGPVNAGNITVLRDIKIGPARTQYNYLGSPVNFVTGENLKTIYPGITFALYYNEANNLFGTSSGANIPGRGLAVKEPTLAGVSAGNTVVTAKYKGVPQNGLIPFPLANSNTATGTSLGYNLLGNPYPSNIDLTKLYELNGGNLRTRKASENIDATFYFWDNEVNNNVSLVQQGSAYEGQAYAIYNSFAGKNGMGSPATGFLDNNSTGKKTPSSVIKVGQGFLTKALVKGYTLNFDNSIRTDAETNVNFLGKSQDQEAEEDRFWLQMISPVKLTSMIGMVYFEGGSTAFGAEDSESKLGSDGIYSVVEDKKVAINGRGSFANSDVVPLGTMHFQAGNYTIAIPQKEGIFANGQNIYLKDKQTGIITNLSLGSYTFVAIAGESTGRFEIIYQPENVLSTDSNSKEALVVYRNGSEFVVRSSGQNITDVQLFDAGGRLILQRTGSHKELRFPAQQLSEGMFVIKATLKSGEILTRKIRK